MVSPDECRPGYSGSRNQICRLRVGGEGCQHRDREITFLSGKDWDGKAFLTALSGSRQLYVGNPKAEWSRLNEIHVQFSEKRSDQ